MSEFMNGFSNLMSNPVLLICRLAVLYAPVFVLSVVANPMVKMANALEHSEASMDKWKYAGLSLILTALLVVAVIGGFAMIKNGLPEQIEAWFRSLG